HRHIRAHIAAHAAEIEADVVQRTADAARWLPWNPRGGDPAPMFVGGSTERSFLHDYVLRADGGHASYCDDKAQAIGINTAVARGDTSTAANNIGFSISSEEVQRVLVTLRDQANGVKREQGYLGVGLTDRTDGGQGAVIANIEDGSPAFKAGIAEGDVVVAINGRPIAGRTGMIAVVRDAQPGDTIKIKIERNGKTVVLSATLVARDTSND
ncbi:MAG: serine protease, partial [Ilumatobacteraceae bacterium]|nr:serine protease [Ilumatobacteraceae bacterium]